MHGEGKEGKTEENANDIFIYAHTHTQQKVT